MKNQLLILSLLFFQTFFVIAQKPSKLEFDELNYKSGMCFGICPLINCTIEKNKTLKIERIIFKKFEVIDTAKSGIFLGRLNKQEWQQLSMHLKSKSLTENNFPNRFCCDNSLVTITIKKNGKEEQFKSMFPQNEALELISFLKQVSLSNRHKKTSYDEALFERLR